jgi:hypothetical protein
VATLKKRKAATLESKVTEVEEETPSTPPVAKVAEILKVMTESLPIKLLSSLGPELMKLLQKKDEPSTTKKVDVQKKRRIGTIMEAIERTPPSAPVTTEANISAKAAVAAEAANLESTLSGIDKLILGMPTEETVAAAKKVMALVPDKGKKIVDAASEEKDFDLRNLVGQELSEAKKKELQEYGISCGYQPGAMLFGGIEEEALGCVHDRTGAKIIGTLSKSVGFLKLRADISSYRRQHIVGSLFYSNFKVKFLWWSEIFLSFLFLRRRKFVDEDLSLQSMLLSKALQMQQDLEDKKNEIIIEGLENKIKEYEASLEKKDFLLQAMEGSLAEAQAENTRLNGELLQKSESFEQERKSL